MCVRLRVYAYTHPPKVKKIRLYNEFIRMRKALQIPFFSLRQATSESSSRAKGGPSHVNPTWYELLEHGDDVIVDENVVDVEELEWSARGLVEQDHEQSDQGEPEFRVPENTDIFLSHKKDLLKHFSQERNWASFLLSKSAPESNFPPFNNFYFVPGFRHP